MYDVSLLVRLGGLKRLLFRCSLQDDRSHRTIKILLMSAVRGQLHSRLLIHYSVLCT